MLLQPQNDAPGYHMTFNLTIFGLSKIINKKGF